MSGRPEPAATAAGSAGPALALTSLQAVVALQALPDATERRRRSIQRGNSLLDRLEELRTGLLEEALSADTLVRLRAELATVVETSGDPALDELLREVEVRAAVELAKLEAAAGLADG